MNPSENSYKSRSYYSIMPFEQFTRRCLLGTMATGTAALAGCSGIISNDESDPRLAGIYVDGSDPETLTMDLLVIVDEQIAFSETMTLERAEDKEFDFTGEAGPNCGTNCTITARVRNHSDWIQWRPESSVREPCYGVEVLAGETPSIDDIRYTPFPFPCQTPSEG